MTSGKELRQMPTSSCLAGERPSSRNDGARRMPARATGHSTIGSDDEGSEHVFGAVAVRSSAAGWGMRSKLVGNFMGALVVMRATRL